MNQKQKIIKGIIIVISLILIVLIGIGIYTMKNEKENHESKSSIEKEVIAVLVKYGLNEDDLKYEGKENQKYKVLDQKQSGVNHQLHYYVDLKAGTYEAIGSKHMKKDTKETK